MTGVDQQVKKPVGVYIIGLIFLLSPLGNILFSLSTSGDPLWYQPQNILLFLQSVFWCEWIWLGLLLLAGILLLKNHRTSWLLAMFTLTVILAMNAYRFFWPPYGQESFSDIFMLMSLLATLAMWTLSFYFRYPYIDRRSQWIMAPANRYDTRTAVQVVANDIYDGVTESVSISGARVLLKRAMADSQVKMRFVDVIFLNVQNIKVTCEVIEYSGNILRLRFKRISYKNRTILMAWLKSHDETP